MKKKQQTTKAPASAFMMNVGIAPFSFQGGIVAGSSKIPVQLQALSGKPLMSFWFGQVVHDLEGMQVEEKIVIDYCHDSNQTLGFLNQFSTDGELLCAGALVPHTEQDRASEIAHKAQNEVPYQASIDFTPSRPDDIVVEELGPGASAVVNGNEVNGPITIFRKWPLRAVAICPLGLDRETSTMLQAKGTEDKEITITMKTDEETTDAAVEQEDNTTEDVEQEGAGDEQESLAVTEEESATEEAEDTDDGSVDTTQAASRSEFKQFVSAFGHELAAKYFEQGVDLNEAYKQYALDLKAQNDKLIEKQAKTSAAAATGASAVDADPLEDKDAVTQFTVNGVKVSEATLKRYAQSTGQTLDQLKAGLLGETKEENKTD